MHSDTGTTNCKGFLMKHDLASFNRSYGLFAKRCIGGRITQSTGWGHGDSAIYIGETPPQAKPKWTQIDHDIAYENVLGYSGTNSKYVNIHDSDFFNNGAGVVPNTLDSEAFQPNSNGRVRDNDIFWNNFNYFLPNSPVQTVSGGLGHIGDATINYPTGVGVILFGSDGWTVQDNRIFGNFMWGAAAFSDPFNSGAVNQKNRFIDNQMGRNGTDTNRFDFFNDGSGKGTCFTGNTSSTFDVTPDAHHSQGFLYPSCPAPNKGTRGHRRTHPPARRSSRPRRCRPPMAINTASPMAATAATGPAPVTAAATVGGDGARRQQSHDGERRRRRQQRGEQDRDPSGPQPDRRHHLHRTAAAVEGAGEGGQRDHRQQQPRHPEEPQPAG